MSQSIASIAAELKGALKQYPDFPEKGILFEDFLPIFTQPALFQKLVDAFKQYVGETKIDYVVGLESRGFLFGPTLALALNAGFVPVRKPGKLPGDVQQVEFKKEYGTDKFEMQKDVFPPGSKILIVDDILATGGSAYGAGELVKLNKGEIVNYFFVMELDFLKGRDKLDAPVFTLLSGQSEKLK